MSAEYIIAKWLIYRMEVIYMERKKGNDRQNMKEEVGPELNPDDLDLREDNDLTEEQYKNGPEKKQTDSKSNNK